jgi:hypothetical protein
MQNPKLQPLAGVIGEWALTATHPMLPDRTITGRGTFAWLENGGFLTWRDDIDDPAFPKGLAIFGTDDGSDEGVMIYSDDRGVSREYRWSISGNVWQWWRDDPDFSQRMIVTISEDGRTLEFTGEMSQKGAAWEPDLQMTYTRSA